MTRTHGTGVNLRLKHQGITARTADAAAAKAIAAAAAQAIAAAAAQATADAAAQATADSSYFPLANTLGGSQERHCSADPI